MRGRMHDAVSSPAQANNKLTLSSTETADQNPEALQSPKESDKPHAPARYLSSSRAAAEFISPARERWANEWYRPGTYLTD